MLHDALVFAYGAALVYTAHCELRCWQLESRHGRKSKGVLPQLLQFGDDSDPDRTRYQTRGRFAFMLAILLLVLSEAITAN